MYPTLRIDCERYGRKNPLPFPYFRSGHMSAICARLSQKEVGVKRVETLVSTLLPRRGARRIPPLRFSETPPPVRGEPACGSSCPPHSRCRKSLLQSKRKEQTFNHLLSGNSILAELLLLCACSLRLLAALYARAFIMLTLAELGKRTRLGTRTLEATQCAVNRLIFLDADLRHSFPSLRTFPSWGSLSTVCIHPYTKP